LAGPWTTNAKLREANSNTDVYKVLVTDAIDVIDADVSFRRDEPEYDGLPLEIFHLCSRLTPLLNIDLLIKDETNRTLLAWRDDEFAGEGWHLPGGIVRFKETLKDRVRQVVEIEIDAPVEVDLIPIAHHEVILSHNTRGHAYSVLYKGSLKAEQLSQSWYQRNLRPTQVGYLEWHASCPNSLIDVHEMYRKYI